VNSLATFHHNHFHTDQAHAFGSPVTKRSLSIVLRRSESQGNIHNYIGIKIGPSVASSITKNFPGKYLVKGLTRLNNIALKTVTEGIEDQAVLIKRSNVGENITQGYFIPKPFPEK